MTKRYFSFLFLLAVFFGAWAPVTSQENAPNIRVVVNMVQLNVAVTDHKGNYITGLRPEDFIITEDKLPQKLATFGEGNEATRSIAAVAAGEKSPADQAAPPASGSNAENAAMSGSPLAGASVFILFDTSNYMYRGFVFAQDAIADFVRSLENADRIAFYSYSRNLLKASTLTPDRSQVIRGIRTTVAGDDAALYNCLLLTLRDAASYTGRKVVVVFSNGPDNASAVPPEDVAEMAQSTGIPIYMISTREARLEPVSTAVFERMTAATGGKAYFASNWRDERKAFGSIRDDLAHLYSLSYYPQPNPNRGWRAITVKLAGNHSDYNIRTRNGYRPQVSAAAAATPPSGSP